MNEMWGNEPEGLGWSRANSGSLLALTTYSRTPLQRKSVIMEFRSTLWSNEEGFKEEGRAAVFCLVWPQFVFSMAFNIAFNIFFFFLPYFHLGHPYFLIWQTSSLHPFFQTPDPTLWMPAVASPCRGCRRRYYLNGSGARTVLTDSRTSPVWGSSTDGPTALNVTFNWIPVIEILPVKTRRTERLPLSGTWLWIQICLISPTAEGGQIARQKWLRSATCVTIITFIVTSSPVWKQQC